MASGDSTRGPAWLERKDMLPTDADLLAADAAALLDPGAADSGRDDVGRAKLGKIELARGKDIGLDLLAWRNQFGKVSTPDDRSLTTGAEGIFPVSQHVGGKIDAVGRINARTSSFADVEPPTAEEVARSLGTPGSLDGPKLEPAISRPPQRVDFYRRQNLDGTVVDSHIPDEGEDGAGTAAPPPMAKVSRWTGVLVGLLVGVAVTVVTLAGAGSDLTLAPAGAIESPKKSDLPIGPAGLASDGPGSGGGSAGSGAVGGPMVTAGADQVSPAVGQATPKPSPKPSLNAAPKPEATAQQTKPTAGPIVVKPTSGTEPTSNPGGKLKITPTSFSGSCKDGLADLDVILDNTSGGVAANWSLQFSSSVIGGPWGSASSTSGVVMVGEYKLVQITPSDVCKVVTSTTTFELTITVNGGQTPVTYTVTP